MLDRTHTERMREREEKHRQRVNKKITDKKIRIREE